MTGLSRIQPDADVVVPPRAARIKVRECFKDAIDPQPIYPQPTCRGFPFGSCVRRARIARSARLRIRLYPSWTRSRACRMSSRIRFLVAASNPYSAQKASSESYASFSSITAIPSGAHVASNFNASLLSFDSRTLVRIRVLTWDEVMPTRCRCLFAGAHSS